MMFKQNTRSLLVSLANDEGLNQSLEKAANHLEAEFIASDDVRETLRKCEEFETTCTVVDIDKIDILHNSCFAQRFCDANALLVLVPAGDIQAAFQAGSLGAINVVEKPIQMDELIANLQTALASESKLEEISHQARFSSLVFDGLTPREKAILDLLMNGEPNKRVAALLDIGLRTVESDRAHVMKKLSVSTFVELVGFVSRAENRSVQIRKDIFSEMLPTRFKRSGCSSRTL